MGTMNNEDGRRRDDESPGVASERPGAEPADRTDSGRSSEAAGEVTGEPGPPLVPAAGLPDELAEQAESAGIDPEDEVSVDPRPGAATDPDAGDGSSDSDGTTGPDGPAPGDGPAEPMTRGFARLGRSIASPRLTAAGALIAVLVGLLGFALIAQVQANSNSTTLSTDRPEDLVRILSDLDARKDRLSIDISNLEDTKRQLESGAQGREAAIADAARRADELGILAGTIGAQGPGLDIALSAGTDNIGAADVLDMVEELRGAGAEAMQISGSDGTAVRIVASTYFADTDSGVVVDGQSLPGTLTLLAIGDPQTMQTALSIPGGAIDTTKSHGGNVQVETEATVHVTALHPATDLKYAQPSS